MRSLAGAALLVLLVAAVSVGEPLVAVEPILGPPHSGRLVSVGVEGLVLSTDAGEIEVQAEDFPRVRRPMRRRRHAARGAAAPQGRVWLLDGTTFPVSRMAMEPSENGVLLSWLVPEDAGLSPREGEVAVEHVASVRLPESPAGFEQPWEVIRSRSPASDVIVTPPRGEGTLDYLEGFVEAMSQEAVTVYLDDEPIEAPRSRVYGVVFAQREADRSSTTPGPVVTAAEGVRLCAANLALGDDGVIQVESPSGVVFRLPWAGVRTIDYRAGRVVSLSGIRPSRSRLTPLFGAAPRGVEGASLPAFRAGSSYWGDPLRVKDSSAIGSRRAFEDGVAIRTGGEVVYPLDGRFGRFQAVVGVDPSSAGRRVVRLEVVADAKELLSKEVAFDDDPLAIDLPVAGAGELLIRVHRLKGLDASVNFGDARLLK